MPDTDRDEGVRELLDWLHERHGRRLCQLYSTGDQSAAKLHETKAAALELLALILRLENGDLGEAVDDEYRPMFRELSRQRVQLQRAKMEERREETAEPDHIGREIS